MTPPLPSLCIDPAAPLRRALQVIDAGGVEIALVVDSEGHLRGTLTDGDIRRALLSGLGLDAAIATVYQRDFIAVGADADRAHVLDLMQARSISQVPVVDASGRLGGLHLLRELIGREQRPNAAVIMAGGRGTRLYPLTLTVPKPMLEVAGRPILERIVLHLVGSGIRTIFLAVNYMADTIERHFRDGSELGCSIRYLRESDDRPLGTAGALTLLPDEVATGATPVLVMNGDLLTSFSVAGLLDAHRRQENVVTVGVVRHSYTVPFGVLDVAAERVLSIEEKPTATWLVNAGVYTAEPDVIARIPRDREYLMTQVLEQCAVDGRRVGVYPLDGSWHDVGRPHDLSRARGDAE